MWSHAGHQAGRYRPGWVQILISNVNNQQKRIEIEVGLQRGIAIVEGAVTMVQMEAGTETANE